MKDIAYTFPTCSARKWTDPVTAMLAAQPSAKWKAWSPGTGWLGRRQQLDS